MSRFKPPHLHLYRPKDTKFWWIWYQWEGKTVRRTLRTEDREEALFRMKALGRKLFLQFHALAPTQMVDATPPRLEELLEKYKSVLESVQASFPHQVEQVRRAKRIIEGLGGGQVMAPAVTAAQVQDYVSKRSTEGAAPDTIRAEVSVLRALFKAGKTYELLSEVPEWPLRLPKARTRASLSPSRGDLVKILEGLKPDRAVDRFIALALYTGLRRADVLSLRWEDLDGGWIRRRTQKTGEAVSVPLHPELLAFLEPAKEDQGPIAPLGARGGAIHKRTLVLCGTPWGSHALRRGFLNLLLEAGVDPRVRADLAGHGVEVELKHYNKSSDRLLLEALNTIKLRPSSAKEEGSATS